MKKVVIVGADGRAWNETKGAMARNLLRLVIQESNDVLFLSGQCPYGGIDEWVEQICRILKKPFKPYPPKKKSWYWYKKRNMEMAKDGDFIIDIEPSGHESGGTWTLNYARSIGKEGMKVEI